MGIKFTNLLPNISKKTIYQKKSIYKILISTEEIFSNILHHSCSESGDEIEISTDFDPLENIASVVFKYGGMEFNPLGKELPDISLPPYKRKLGGLGLLIVKKFADDVTYKYSGGKNILEISKKIIDF
ncbi:MAG: ATP-binding protein [Clostridia bacterium]|nr:ATP-binding protein [Clostridia bacterium]